MSIEISSGHGQVPQQLEDYFDLVTQFKLAQKRERDWQMTFRELVKDDDSIIDQSDEDFVRTWGANLSGGQKYLNETLVALQATQMTCEKHNIDTRACQLSILPSHTGLQTPSVTGTEANLGQREPGTSSATPIEPESSNDMSMRCFAMIRPFYAFPPRYSPPPMTNLELYMQMIRGEPGPGMTLSTDGTDSGERTRLDGPQRAQSSDKRPRVVRESRLPAELNGREILAFPDVGAAANFIALRYVHSQGLTINSKARKLVHTAVGSVVDIMGTVTLPFSFRGEQKVHELEFNVMRNAVHEVIIGSPFLKLTKTFTRYKHRLQQMLREVRLPRMRYLGSHQYLRGQVNGSYVDAVPDTGADVPVMSMSFAREHGFKVATDPRHRVLLEFADGSAATSIGMVKDMDWSFRGSNYRHRINVYVLEELQTGLILDNTFLYDTDAFVAHGRDFWTDEEGSLEDGWMVSIIKLVDRALKGSRCTISCKLFVWVWRWHL
jgi:predicted aspartyl protease